MARLLSVRPDPSGPGSLFAIPTRTRPIIRLLVLAISSWLLATPVAAQQKRVLVLFSSAPDSFISAGAVQELPALLNQTVPEGVDYYAEYFELARFPDPDFAPAFASYLKTKYHDRTFDAILTVQNTANQFMAKYRDELFPGTPMVFIETRPTTDRPPNATGIMISVDLRRTIELAAALQPGLRTVYVVTGGSAQDRIYDNILRRQLAAAPPTQEVVFLTGLARDDLERRLSSLPDGSMVYYLTVFADRAGAPIRSQELAERLAAVANVPTYSWLDSTMGRGILGGNVLSRAAVMHEGARLVARVLSGEPASRIAVGRPDVQIEQVDWRQLRRFQITAAVPAGVEVLNAEASFWSRYRVYVIGAVTIMAAQTALMISLLVSRRRRLATEQQLHRSQQHLQGSYERIRALGGRLLKAQEHERAHVARELHDDISQQMALLQIDLNMLAEKVPETAEELAGEALDRAKAITRSVHDLSHRLHPARLRLLGLVPTIQGLAQEMSRSGVDIRVEARDVPTLPPDLSVAIFRVVQEALQNALKYSGASEVIIRLEGTMDRLLLSITDNGTGFDVQAAWGSGLGLLSMRERLEAVGGTIEVQSRRGSHTRVEASVPVAPADSGAGLMRA
jgi:signal transduction histidine kinase